MKLFIILGSINMALAVAIGAFGAHGLKGKVSNDMLGVWNTGAHYHIIHALALLFIGLLMARLGGNSWFVAGGWLLLVGIILFSGSLYALVLTNVKVLGAITPLGGLSFIAGWILVAVGAAKDLT